MGTQLAVLSATSVGMWSAKKDQGMWFLIVPRRHLLVFIVESDSNSSSMKRRSFGPIPANLLRQLGAHSPFSSVVHRDGGCAFAFEVSFENISGIDCSISLLLPGRLVLEAHKVHKREFESLEAAFSYYGGADGEATRASLDALFGDESPLKQRPAPWETTPSPSPANSLEKEESSMKNSTSPASASTKLTSRRNLGGNFLAALSGAMDKTRAKVGGLAVKTKSTPGMPPETPASTSSSASFLSKNESVDLSQPRLEESTTPRMFPRSFSKHSGGTTSSGFSQPIRLSHSASDLLQMTTPVPEGITYDFRLITVHWTDPQLPELLRPVIESNEKLLRMYESGLPAWATFFPRAGLYYKPWLRTLSWILFYAFSLFSLAAGFYDLYKTLPGLQALLSRFVAGLWLPPAAVLAWIESSLNIRLSILLTYLFGKSEILVYVVRMLGHVKRVVGETAGPVVDVVVPPIVTVVKTGIAPAIALLRTLTDFICTVLLPPLQALYSVVVLPLTWVTSAARHAVTVGQGMFLGGTAAASATPWILRAVPADVLDALRVSLGRATRAAQSIWRTIMQMIAAFTRHRLTLSRRMVRWRRRMRERIVGSFWFVIECFVVCFKWIWAIVYLMVAAAKAGAMTGAAIVEEKNEEEKEESLVLAGSSSNGNDLGVKKEVLEASIAGGGVASTAVRSVDKENLINVGILPAAIVSGSNEGDNKLKSHKLETNRSNGDNKKDQ